MHLSHTTYHHQPSTIYEFFISSNALFEITWYTYFNISAWLGTSFICLTFWCIYSMWISIWVVYKSSYKNVYKIWLLFIGEYVNSYVCLFPGTFGCRPSEVKRRVLGKSFIASPLGILLIVYVPLFTSVFINTNGITFMHKNWSALCVRNDCISQLTYCHCSGQLFYVPKWNSSLCMITSSCTYLKITPLTHLSNHSFSSTDASNPPLPLAFAYSSNNNNSLTVVFCHLGEFPSTLGHPFIVSPLFWQPDLHINPAICQFCLYHSFNILTHHLCLCHFLRPTFHFPGHCECMHCLWCKHNRV